MSTLEIISFHGSVCPITRNVATIQRVTANLERVFCMANLRSKEFFVPATLDIFLPRASDFEGVWNSNPRYTMKIIGKGQVTMALSQKSRDYWIIQSSTIPSLRYAIFVPKGMVSGFSVTFMERTKRGDGLRIRINRKKGVWVSCSHPKTGSTVFWQNSVMYQKIKRKWVIIEIDGRPVNAH
jgi:hypothetical protein